MATSKQIWTFTLSFLLPLLIMVTSSLPAAVSEHSNHLNKPALKSIKSPDGDIIDCVSIDNQPAFDHPLLKNHTIQLTPKFHPEWGKFGQRKVSSKADKTTTANTQLWHLKGIRCPVGTIPIRRTKRSDVSKVKAFGTKKLSNLIRPQSNILTQSGHQHAIVYVEDDQFYGAKATLNVWRPQIQQPNEFSLSQIWVLGGTFAQDLNSIEAGWQVSPDLYGDNNTRLFSYWTSDAYQATGCYNLLCSGFIQINNEIAMGASIYPLSGYGSPQYDISILIWKDPIEGNWWMQFGNEHVLGYWPGSLFSYLSESASMIEWGGEVVNLEADGQHTNTQMGSGHFPQEGFGKASYFKNIQIVDGSNTLKDPKGITTFTEQPNCYDVQIGKGDNWGNYFYYGGPGRNPDCL
ncbi:hypothetical protein ACFE04_011638 [Oxalis oulophora]